MRYIPGANLSVLLVCCKDVKSPSYETISTVKYNYLKANIYKVNYFIHLVTEQADGVSDNLSLTMRYLAGHVRRVTRVGLRSHSRFISRGWSPVPLISCPPLQVLAKQEDVFLDPYFWPPGIVYQRLKKKRKQNNT